METVLIISKYELLPEDPIIQKCARYELQLIAQQEAGDSLHDYAVGELLELATRLGNHEKEKADYGNVLISEGKTPSYTVPSYALDDYSTEAKYAHTCELISHVKDNITDYKEWATSGEQERNDALDEIVENRKGFVDVQAGLFITTKTIDDFEKRLADAEKRLADAENARQARVDGNILLKADIEKFNEVDKPRMDALGAKLSDMDTSYTTAYREHQKLVSLIGAALQSSTNPDSTARTDHDENVAKQDILSKQMSKLQDEMYTISQDLKPYQKMSSKLDGLYTVRQIEFDIHCLKVTAIKDCLSNLREAAEEKKDASQVN